MSYFTNTLTVKGTQNIFRYKIKIKIPLIKKKYYFKISMKKNPTKILLKNISYGLV